MNTSNKKGVGYVHINYRLNIFRIRNKLADAERQRLPLSDITGERLRKHVEIILNNLPSDLQAVLQNGTVLTNDPERRPEDHPKEEEDGKAADKITVLGEKSS